MEEKTIIKIKHYNITVTVKFPADSDIFEVAQVIKGMLVVVGWQPESVEKGFEENQ